MLINHNNNKYIHFIPLWLTLLSVASLLSLHPIYNVNWYSEKRLIQIIIISSLVFSILFFQKTRTKLIDTFLKFSLYTKLSLVTVFSIGLFSSFQANVPTMALVEVANFFLLVLLTFFIGISRVSLKKSIDKLFILVFVACASAYALSFFSALLAGIMVTGIIDYHELLMGVVNRRFLNQVQSISFPILLIAPLLLSEKKITRGLLILLAGFWFMLMILSDGRGVIVATLVGIIFSGILFPKVRSLWWKYSFLVILIGTLFYLLINWALSFYTVIGGDVLRETTGGRLSIWINILSSIKDAPLLGFGPMSYAFQAHDISVVAHPHNITLQLLYEWGIPATLIILSLVTYGFWRWSEQQRKIQSISYSLFSIALTSAFIAGLTHGQFSGIFVMPLSQLTFVLVSGWMIGIYLKNNNIEKTSQKYRPSIIHYSLLLLVSLSAYGTILFGIYPQFQYLTTEVKAEPSISYKQGNYPAYNAPRYWLGTFVKSSK